MIFLFKLHITKWKENNFTKSKMGQLPVFDLHIYSLWINF
jgi:hypothetical protein